ncbi:MAG TPA: amino acid adenylation domain-containing protein [Pyrinomonadaceae bacterium]|nr:amino acid adenylation domain-containing protein [Pyrinomonadaceae bacterium]
MLTEAEAVEQVEEWNATAREYPRTQSVAELFEQEAARGPEAVAVVCGAEEVSYDELNRRANQVAHYLRELGVRAEVSVGLCLERSVEMVVGLLGILKAGGAYVPLDPDYPLERLHFMLEDAGVSVLLTQERLLSSLPTHHSQVVCLDRDREEIAQRSERNPEVEVAGDNLAYVMYTSGSTGQAKGVSVTHRNIVRLVQGTEYVEFGSEEVFLQMAPITFDASTFELWGSLLHGAKLVMMAAGRATLAELGAALQEHKVSTLWLTAGLFHLLVDEGVEALRGVRQVLAGGDALSVAHVQQVLSRLERGQRLINGYGPTEGTTFSCCQVLEGESEIGGSVPIGRPIANSTAFVLDAEQQLVPVGVVGELYLGGDGLARGYLNRAELTAEKFIPHPFSREAGARLYRTGDRVRYLADGRLEFLGRWDQQVKIRGFRVELGEIESLVAGYHGVQSAVVAAPVDERGEKRLVGYVVWEREASHSQEELQSYLRQRLPEYMVPGTIITLAEMPLTGNGKVDRRALPRPEQVQLGRESDYVAAQTPIQEMLATIWGEVLQVERVGLKDDFFEMGGHSLLATQLLSRVREVFHLEIALRHIFEEPTLAAFAAVVQQALRAEPVAPPAPILPISRDLPLPLSFAQQRLWFIEQLEPTGAAYNIPQVLRISGRLDVGALETACNEIVRRHEILRTVFVVRNGEPTQVINPFGIVSIPVTDLSALPREDLETARVKHCIEEVRRAFDLEHGPLIRVRLIRLDSEEHVLVLTMHHIITDGWSYGVLVRELTTLYENFRSNGASTLPELPIQYADYAAWQRRLSFGHDEQLNYWRRQLDGSLPILEIPTDRLRPAQLSYRGANLPFTFSASLTRQLKQLSLDQGATLFMTLLAGFQSLLYRYTGQEDVVVGTPIANRQRVEMENLIGFFVNTLTMRVDLSGTPTFKELLRRVRDVAIGAYAHQDIPFETLVRELQPDRDLSRNPLFQVLFALQNAPSATLELPDLTLTLEEFESGSTRFDLECLIWEQQEHLRGVLVYSEDLFDHDTVERLLKNFEVLLMGIVEAPDTPINTLPLLTGEQQRQVLTEWNDTTTILSHQECVHQVVAQQALHQSDAVALMFAHQQLSYRELNRRANQLAHYLQKMGVGPEATVGIMMERSVEMLIAVLATLKAGGAYLPLDPEFPRDRLSFMLADAQARVLLTQSRLLESLPDTATRVLCPENEKEAIGREAEEDPPSRVTSANLAYVIYTSGSTGKPKAVAMPHGALINLIEWQASQSPGTARTLQFASLSFDVSFQEIFSTWCTGGTLILVDEGTRRDSSKLLRVLVESAADRLFLPYVALQYLAQTAAIENVVPEKLRQVLTAGEQLKITKDIRSLFTRIGDCSLENHYGPSETHLVSAFTLAGSAGPWPELPPIGWPIANTQLYVLDRWMYPVPPGVAGELYIGGDCLARGYLNRPETTAEKFIPDPFSARSGALLYRTGDLVRHLPGGILQFLGRRDDQAKVRGYRIEMGEVETALRQHALVRDAVVTVDQMRTGEKRLIAYVLVDQDTVVPAADLRSHLAQKLPEYMVPSAFFLLNRFPLTPSGKINRLGFPRPEEIELNEENAYVAPGTTTQQLLAEIWADVLGVGRVGIHDNFFELGGHSLLATRLMSRVREAFRVEIALRSLFEKPSVAGLAEIVDSEMHDGRDLEIPPPAPVPRAGALPLSFAQERMWFLYQLEAGSATYNISSATRLKGQLNTLALEQSFNDLVRRHEALRTSFANVDGRPVQLINEAAPIALDVSDLSAVPDPETEARRLVEEESLQPFDLETGPLMRVRVLRLGAEEHVLLLTMHHIISDGWSIGILVREMTELYSARAKGESPELAGLPIQYADFSLWQRQWLTGEALDRQLSYWRKQLQSPLPVVELPLDKVRPAVQTYRGAQEQLELSLATSRGLKEIGRRFGVTPFMVLVAAFKVLLCRYTGQEDITIGTPIAGRNRAELEGLIGFLVNTLVLRTDVSGNPPFNELLDRVREVTLGAYQHQDLPFEKLVDSLQPARDRGHTPLFQIMFALQNNMPWELRVPGLELSPIEIPDATAKFDLLLVMSEADERLAGTFSYNTDLFTAATIKRLATHFASLLTGIVGNPNQRLSELPLLADEERRQLLEWGQAASEYPRDSCITDLFEAQVERAPAAVALVFQDTRLTYDELNQRANQLAHYLVKAGLKPAAVVGVCLERSVEMIVALLGILKAGAAYLPVDLSQPRDRLRSMLSSARVAMFLTRQSLADRLPPADGQRVFLDAEAARIGLESKANLRNFGASGEDLAYVMFTSGSTGQPKGVSVTHRNVVRLVKNTNYVRFDADQTFLQLAPISFDASTFEIWGSLLNGSRLVIMPAPTPTLEELSAILQKHQVTILWLTAGLFHQMVDYHPQALRSLRYLLAGGDVLSVQHVKRLLEGDPGLHLINGYGPTESTTFACCHSMSHGDVGATVPIGKPISNTEAYVLDEQMQIVPQGVSGELYLGGDGLARGYLNRPDLTAERFVPNPYTSAMGGRLYRTGDLVRYLADGNLEFLGRRDDQVKVRGFRVELSEIELVLAEHPLVRETLVVAHKMVAEDKRLTAYVVSEGQAAPSGNELRAFLREKLPAYMLPSSFVFLEALPLTRNGKVDRRALPLPEDLRDVDQRDRLSPRTPVEDLLSNIWAQVLDLKLVHPDDNFFELGGHSLLATQVMARIRAAFVVELPLQELFMNPTVATLAQSVERVLTEGGENSAPPLVNITRDQDLPLSFAQQRLWFVDQLEPDSTAYHLPVAVRLTGALDVATLSHSLSEVARRQEALRTVFRMSGDLPTQVILPPAELDVPLIDLTELDVSERESKALQLCAAEVRRPFDLEHGPLLRGTVMRLGEREHVLLLVMHHIVSDAGSLEILVHEVTSIYQAHSAGQSSPLPELTRQYADYASWQREWLQGEVLEKLVAYWKRRLAGAPPLLELPADRPRPSVQSFRGAKHSFELSPELSAALRKLSQREGATLFMTLLAAFQTLLYRYTGREDVVLGADVNNRNRLETERMIGFFINMLVLRADLTGDPTFQELLRRSRRTLLEDYAHSEVPFEKLVEELQPERSVSYAPLFQVVFNFNNSSLPTLQLPDLSLHPWPLEFNEVKFDLSLFMWDRTDGLSGMWTYSTDLFEPDRISRLQEHFVTLLQSIVEDPEQRLSALAYLTPAEQMAQSKARKKLKQTNLQKFKTVRPRAITRSAESLIRTELLAPDEPLPLVIQPQTEEVALASWAKDNAEFIEARLLQHGALLFRNFEIGSMADFAAFTGSICPELLAYREPSSPRTELGEKIYTSTEYPPDQWIQLHNEMSYAHNWPRTVYFYCELPAQQGGATPIAYSRKIFEALDPKIRERFIERKVMYVRNFDDRLDLPWQHVFQASNRAAVEAYCRNAQVEFEWQDGERLKTRQVRQAVIKHPRTGETVWFNQAHAFHIATLDAEVREFLLSERAEESFPRQAYYGDGSPIEASVIAEIREAYRQAAVTFTWQRGDILMLDNMQVAHGRAPFAGPRKVLVAMSGCVSSRDVKCDRDLG